MAVFLLLLCLLTGAYVCYFAMPGARRPAAGTLAKLLTAGYLSLSALITLLMMGAYLLHPGEQAGRAVRHIEYRGVNVSLSSLTGDASDIRLTGDPIEPKSKIHRGFRWYALERGASIWLRATETKGDQISRIAATAHAPDQVVRLNGVCLNEPIGHWAKSNVIALNVGTGKASFPLLIALNGGRVQLLSNGRPVELTDHLTLRELITASRLPADIDALSRILDASGVSVLDRIRIVRKLRGDSSSPIGVIGAAPGLPISCQVIDAESGNVQEVASDKGFHIDCSSDQGPQRLIVSQAAPEGTGSAAVRFSFDPPRSFPLPPAEVLAKNGGLLQFASVDVGQRGDGYLLDTGNFSSIAIQKLKVDPDHGGLQTPQLGAAGFEPVSPDKPQLLGDGSVRAVYALADPLAAPGSQLWMPAVGVTIGYLGCMGAFCRIPGWKRRVRRGPTDLAPIHAAFVLWVVLTAVLAVRVLLAYRVAVFPPFNMSSTAAASYRSCWPKAVAACLLLPSVFGIMVMAVVRGRELTTAKELLEKLPAARWAKAADALFWICLAMSALQALHKRMELFPFPAAALFTLALLTVGVVVSGIATTLADESSPVVQRFSRWLLVLVMLLLLYDDPGLVVFEVPLALAWCAGRLSYNFGVQGAGWLPRAQIAALTVLVLGGIVFSPAIGARLLVSPLARTINSASSFPYRFVATDVHSAEELLIDPGATPNRFRPVEMRRALLQRWQMKSYLKGAGAGYFQAPLTNAGMTYGTMLSDAVFSVFLVGEHGRLAGACVVLLFVLLSLSLFRTAWVQSFAREGRVQVRALYAVAGMIGGSAVYMGLANLWAVPFAGENIPLLSLDSFKDVVLNGTLFVLALVLLAIAADAWRDRDTQALRDAKKDRLAWWSLPVLVVFGFGALVWQLSLSAGDARQPFNLEETTLTSMEKNATSAWREARTRHIALHETEVYKQSSALMRSALADFESGAVTQTPLVASRTGAALTVDHSFYQVRSPFDQDLGVPWHGSLLADTATLRHELYVNGSREPIDLEPHQPPAILLLDSDRRPIHAQSVDLDVSPKGRGGEFNYGGLKLQDGKVVFRWRTSGKPGVVLINGVQPDLEYNRVELQPNDVVTLSIPSKGGLAESYSLFYPGPTNASLAAVVWRNGKYVRTFPEGSGFSLAASIAEAADLSPTKLQDVKLSIDLSLQEQLQRKLSNWAAARGRPVGNGARRPEGLPFTALSVIDSYTGQIRALASVPQADPSMPYDDVRDSFNRDRDAMTAWRSNWNFVDRTIGSTIKPLAFSALCSQLDSKGFRLEDLKVDEASAVEGDPRAYRKLGDLELKRGKTVSGREAPRGEVDMFTFLKDSRTWPAVVASTIGLVTDKSDLSAQKAELKNLLTPSASGQVWIGGERMSLHPLAALPRLFVSGKSDTLNSLELDQSAYFQGIEDCYGPNAVPFDFNGSSRADQGFLGPIVFGGPKDAALRQFLLPDLHVADTTSMTDFDNELLRYMIGAGECRWCALTMAVNGARVVTGKRVLATLSADPGPKPPDMPWPIKDFKGWRQPHLLSPLEQISTLVPEDAAAIRKLVSDAGYRIVMKTGTIDDGSGQNGYESEMLMFTVGKYNESTGFVPGQSVSGFLSIRSSKKMNGDEMIKGDLARSLIPVLLEYLHRGNK